MHTNNIIKKMTGAKRLMLLSLITLLSCVAWAQDGRVLRGRIVDPSGDPIPGAVVNVSEASRIALSDKDGYFNLKNVKQADELCIKSVGFLSTTAIADFDPDFQIVMEPDADMYTHTTPVPFGRSEERRVGKEC